jgi:hypothetical protein
MVTYGTGSAAQVYQAQQACNSCAVTPGTNSAYWQPIADAPGAALLPSGTGVIAVNSGATGLASAHQMALPVNCSAASGSPTTYTCSTSPAFSPAAGDYIQFKADVANTGAATLSVNGGTAYPVRKAGGAKSIVAGDLLAGTWIQAKLDGTYWQLEGQLGNDPTVPTSEQPGTFPTGVLLPSSQVTGLGGLATATGTGTFPYLPKLGANQVGLYACGIAINDGAVHTISTLPSTSWCYGVTTLAQLAALTIPGTSTQPFSWITTYTEGGNLVFTYSGGVYKFTNSSVPNIDIAWLALQAAMMTQSLYAPGGIYIVGSTLNTPLLNLPVTGNMNNVMIGDGDDVTIIQAGHDFGLGVPLMSCGDPAGTYLNNLGRYLNSGNTQCNGNYKAFTIQSSNPYASSAKGSSNVQMDGWWWGAHENNEDVEVRGFYKGWDIYGDHTTFKQPYSTNNLYSYYWDYSYGYGRYGELVFVDLAAINPGIGALVADPGGSIGGRFIGQTYSSYAPYFFYSPYSASRTVTQMIELAHFDNLFVEYTGNGVAIDDSITHTGTYVDTNAAANASHIQIDQYEVSYSNAQEWTAGGRYRRAAWNLRDLSDVHICGVRSDAGTPGINADATGNLPVGTFDLLSVGATVPAYGLDIGCHKGDIGAIINSGYPVFALPKASSGNGSFTGFERVSFDNGSWRGKLALVAKEGNRTSVNQYEVLTIGAYGSDYQGGYSIGYGDRVVGVTQAAGTFVTDQYSNTFALVPYANEGYTQINYGYNAPYTYGDPAWTLFSGIGPITITTAGSGGTAGNYNITATGGGCTTEPIAAVTVASGAISAVTVASGNAGTGCTSAPSFSLSSITGLTGGAISPQWPSGVAAQASSATQYVFGVGVSAYSQAGTQAAGTQQITTRLIGLK